MIEPVQPAAGRRDLPATPQMAVRVAVLGGVALVLFAIVFFRLWYLQVLSGEQYVSQADNNRVRDLPIPAPRGDLLDRNGLRLASDRLTNAVQIVPDQLPADAHARIALYRHLGSVLGMSAHDIGRRVAEQHKLLPYANVTIKTDAGTGVLGYLYERQREFPGVQQQAVYLRNYPDQTLAAQVLGYVGQIGPSQLGQKRFAGVGQGTIVGQYGVELAYDRYVRGRTGAQRVQVNSLGQLTGSVSTVNPLQGHDLKLSVDYGLQHEGEVALGKAIGLAQGNGHPASAGAFVALDPRNGEVLAMGSEPSFNPNVFARPLTQAQYNQLIGTSGQTPGPLFNRAISGGYPTGSTFKPITALASLQTGLISPDAALGGGQCITVGAAQQQFCNAGKANYGDLPMREALKVSSDTYFFTLGELANSHGAIIQDMAHRLGLGQPTGIDLPGESTGVIPDRNWRANQATLEIACEQQRHVPSCGISDKRPWTVGDNVNLAVGQGDVEASPLQMAVAYSTIANGGTVVRPHLGVEIDDNTGRLIQKISKPPVRHVALDAGARSVVLDGLHAATTETGGTSADVWAGWGQSQHPIFGKTGTAQHSNQDDQSWYVCFAPDPVRPIVIAVTVEQGGFGAEAAAPAARLMMSQWFHAPAKLVAGHSRTR